MSAETTPVARARGWPRLPRRLAGWDAAVVALTVLTLLVASGAVDEFGTTRNATFLILDLAPVLLLALPMTLIVVSGEIDLSVASTVGLTSALIGELWAGGLPLETIVPLAVLAGAVLGAVNGLLVTVLGLPSLAVTIGTLALYRGLAYVLLGDTAVADFARDYTRWANGSLGDGWVPNVVPPILLLVVAFALALHATPVGRAIFAMGANDTAAAFAGIPVERTKFWLYVVSGAVAGLVGVYWTLRYSTARADNAEGLELTVVAAVLLGGVSIYGGRGTLLGVVAGVVLLTSLQNALRLAKVSADALTVITGTLLILSVLLPNVSAALRARLRRHPTPVARTAVQLPEPTRRDGPP
ncbi:ABC transporter permease [Streptomyces sp. 3MP-14]|uniref:Autoinducer 2 import system permease protein LsrD n=1 Tax=Streptomyces mimosae TaxID=2586635 RepID=A0A5N6A071_9ACTN|nr:MULTISPECIES: ABC transporter permease [Streptomyces]KAB8162131.1 ABC transporter permease [Streptomyces mimosae]KAB8173971.1 ABC transporter permease [Streptomyces sp. 3MP-14]